MSLINNVLKDLEDKPSAFTPLELAVPARDDKPGRGASVITLAVVFLLLLVLGLLVVNLDAIRGYLSAPPGDTASAPVPQAQSPGLDSMAVTPEPPIPVTPQQPPVNRITGLQISETGDSMVLAFQFSQPAQSFLRKRGDGLYLFHVGNIEQAMAAPEIGGNDWLRSMQLNARDEGVDIRFDTHRGVMVETEQSSGDRGYRWLIRLTRPAPLSANEAPGAKAAGTMETAQSSVAAAPVAAPAKAPAVQAQETASTEPGKAPAADVRLQIRPSRSALSDAQKLSRAGALVEAGALSEAGGLLRGLVGGQQDRPARLRLVAVLEALGRTEQRDAQIVEGFARYPADMAFIRLQAGLLFERKQYQALVERFASSSGNLELYSLLAASYQRLGQHEQAVVAYRKALALDSAQARLWVSLAISQQHLDQPRAALQSYRMAKRSGLTSERLLEFVNRRIDSLARL